MRGSLLFILALMFAAPALSQGRAPSAAERTTYEQFYQRLLGAWNCQIREYDEAGAVTWSDEQVRVFERSFLGFGVEERAYKPPRLSRDENFGFQLFLLQPGLQMTQYGIWPGGASVMFTAQGSLRADGSGIDSTMVATDDTGQEDHRRKTLEWTDANQLAVRIYRQRTDGSEYLYEELIYTPRSSV